MDTEHAARAAAVPVTGAGPAVPAGEARTRDTAPASGSGAGAADAGGPAGGSAPRAADAADAVALDSLDTPVGPVLFAVTAAGLSGVAFGTSARWRARLTGGLRAAEDPGRTAMARDQLGAYFAGTRRGFDLPLDWRHAPSRLARETLELLFTTVPYGATVTYGELAGRVSERRGGAEVPARAIGSVMGANPIPIVVPCHRVVAGNGLGGFSGGSGVEVKRRLLEHEGALPPTLDFGI